MRRQHSLAFTSQLSISGENGSSIEDREIGADINEEMLIDNEANAINQIWATIEYGALDSIALNL